MPQNYVVDQIKRTIHMQVGRRVTDEDMADYFNNLLQDSTIAGGYTEFIDLTQAENVQSVYSVHYANRDRYKRLIEKGILSGTVFLYDNEFQHALANMYAVPVEDAGGAITFQKSAVQHFKSCPMCDSVDWGNRDAFLEDESVVLLGYQAVFDDPMKGLFLFNHDVCATTMAIPVTRFMDLQAGEIYQELKTGKKGCKEFCLDSTNLESCKNKCSMVHVRNVIVTIKSMKQ